ncbi:uncharacterized protein LOC119670845 [Teleopsis dalmanni]|uniref:uncharacterized protein LOC119670845 n=1 Tax=Teleopsis dalmanni TaxID=139649 RepID=UPI0018CE9160|nr:uncharacterized protein LOC119670845 [Teleopsis dalmanni]
MYCYICSKKFGIFCKVFNCSYCKHYFCVNCLSSNPPPVCFVCYDKLTNSPVAKAENVQSEEQPTTTTASSPTGVQTTITSTKRSYCATTPSEFEYIDRAFSDRLKAIFFGIADTTPPSHYQRQQEEKVNKLMQHYQRVKQLKRSAMERAPQLLQLPCFESTLNALRDMHIDSDSSDSSDSSTENDFSSKQIFELIASKYVAGSPPNKMPKMVHMIRRSEFKEELLFSTISSGENQDVNVEKPNEGSEDVHFGIVSNDSIIEEEKEPEKIDVDDDKIME